MTSIGNGNGDKGPTVQDSAVGNDYASGDDDPYVVFGYGSLIFRVRCAVAPFHCNLITATNIWNPHGRTHTWRRRSLHLTSSKRVRIQLVFVHYFTPSLCYLGIACVPVRMPVHAHIPGGASVCLAPDFFQSPTKISNRIASDRIAATCHSVFLSLFVQHSPLFV